MQFNFQSHLDSVERSVSLLEREGRPASGVTLARTYAVSVDDLWDAITNSDRIPLWFQPVSGNLVVGGRYQIEGNADGTITACKPPSHFTLTWEFGGDISWVAVHLTDAGHRSARLTLTHTALISEHWDKFGPSAAGAGWELGSLGLAFHLAQPAQPKPDEVAFATSSDGKSFITGSCEKWGRADVIAGTAPEVATAAARRTAAFYTLGSTEAG